MANKKTMFIIMIIMFVVMIAKEPLKSAGIYLMSTPIRQTTRNDEPNRVNCKACFDMYKKIEDPLPGFIIIKE